MTAKVINITEARPREDRGDRGGRFNNNRGGGYGSNRGGVAMALTEVAVMVLTGMVEDINSI